MIRDRSHSLFPVIVLTLLAGVSVWLDRVTQQDPVAKTDKTRHEADFSAERITLHRFDPTGKVQYILVADHEGRLVGALNHHDLMLAKVI